MGTDYYPVMTAGRSRPIADFLKLNYPEIENMNAKAAELQGEKSCNRCDIVADGARKGGGYDESYTANEKVQDGGT